MAFGGKYVIVAIEVIVAIGGDSCYRGDRGYKDDFCC